MALFTIPSREQLFDYFIGNYAQAQPEKNVARGSDPYRLGRVVSGAIWTLLAKLLFYVKNSLPDTAEKELLERWGGVYAFPRLAAAGAKAKLGLHVTGTVGAPVPVDSELAHEDGTTYRVATDGAAIGAGGYVDVDVEAKSTGTATNKGVGELLQFTAPPSNVDADATVTVKLTGGVDIESYDAYRVRLLAHIGDPPQGGAIHDYIEWLKKIPGVKDAYIWAHRRGTGTIDLAILGPGTGAARIVSADVELAADTAVELQRPAGARDFVILTPVPVTTNVKCTIDIDLERYGWDWDDAGVGYAITAYDSNASTITVPTLPVSVVAGMRIQVRGEEALITLRVGNVLTLSFEPDYDGNGVSWFVIDPNVNGQMVRASGDLVKPVKNAILALFNTLGPARFISAASPDGYARTSWSASLKLSKLNAAITDVDGVDDCTITDPVITTVAVDDLDATTIDYLSPVKVEVLKP